MFEQIVNKIIIKWIFSSADMSFSWAFRMVVVVHNSHFRLVSSTTDKGVGVIQYYKTQIYIYIYILKLIWCNHDEQDKGNLSIHYCLRQCLQGATSTTKKMCLILEFIHVFHNNLNFFVIYVSFLEPLIHYLNFGPFNF